jgi:hypothetical protein
LSSTPEAIEKGALFGSVVAGIVAATSGWFGYGTTALIAGVIAAGLPFLQSQAAAENLKNVLAPRSLNQATVKKLIKKLAIMNKLDCGTARPVAIFPTSDSFESASLADQLDAAFTAANWRVNRNTVHYGNPMNVRGIGVLAHEFSDSEVAAEYVVDALVDAGMDSFVIAQRVANLGTVIPLDRTDPYYSSISIMVGDK